MAKTNISSADLKQMGLFEDPKHPGQFIKSPNKPIGLVDENTPNMIATYLRIPAIAPMGITNDKHRKITLTLFGEPMPKQSVRSFASGAKTKHGNYVINHYQPAKMKERTLDYISQIRKQLPKDFKLFENEVHITKFHCIYSPLKSFHKVKGKMDAIRNGEIFYKNTQPDLIDNLKKLIFDSMAKIVFTNDGIIVTENNTAKYYGVGGCIIIEMHGY